MDVTNKSMQIVLLKMQEAFATSGLIAELPGTDQNGTCINPGNKDNQAQPHSVNDPVQGGGYMKVPFGSRG